jgi:outer membrane protein TolC
MNRDKNIVFDIDTNYTIKNYESETLDTTTISASRSDIKSIDQEIKLAQLKQQLEWSKRLPEFGIKYDNMFAFGTTPNQFSIMGMITIPIVPWSSKMYKSNVAGIKYEIESYQKQKESLVNETSGEIISLQTQIKSKKLQVDLYKNNIIPALEKNYKTTLLAYDQNTEDLFSVLDAWQSLKLGRIEYLEIIKDLLLLQVEFEKQIEK